MGSLRCEDFAWSDYVCLVDIHKYTYRIHLTYTVFIHAVIIFTKMLSDRNLVNNKGSQMERSLCQIEMWEEKNRTN